jgi:PAS domain-containing protein
MTNTDAPYFSIFENALDLLSDGIALVRSDRTIIYVNKALRGLAACSGELRIDRNTIEFATPGLRDRLTRALSALDHARPAPTCHAADFAIPRADDLPPYIVSVRRLAPSTRGVPRRLRCCWCTIHCSRPSSRANSSRSSSPSPRPRFNSSAP